MPLGTEYLTKVDINSAYRMVPVHTDDGFDVTINYCYIFTMFSCYKQLQGTIIQL